MAKITSTGIVFGDSTSLTSKFGIIPQDSATIFYQSSAPSRWTKSTTHNNKTLRVVSGNGGGSGGSTAFTSVFPNSQFPVSGSFPISAPTTGDFTLTTAEMPTHSHTGGSSISFSEVPALFNPDGAFVGWNGGDVVRDAGWSRNSPTTGDNGSGGAHNHPWSGNASFAQNLDLRVQYVDVLLCTFDG